MFFFFLIQACLKVDNDGNTPAMIAAMNNHKQALLQLLAPFITSNDKEVSKQNL